MPTIVGPASAAELQAALDEHRIVAVFQPAYDLATGTLVAVEALARLQDKTTGLLLPPAVFVPLAEECGLISQIDVDVARQAIGYTARLRATPLGKDLSVAVNLSVRDLDEADLAGRYQQIAVDAGLPLDALILEVTETVLSRASRGHEKVLAEFSSLGCNVTLDDFGTGNNSFAYLQRFQVQGLKIDRSFTRQLGDGRWADRVTAGLIRFGIDLGIHVVAEGIETLTHLRSLQRLGCPFGQGYLLSRPHEAADIDLTRTPPAFHDVGRAADAVPLQAPRRSATQDVATDGPADSPDSVPG